MSYGRRVQFAVRDGRCQDLCLEATNALEDGVFLGEGCPSEFVAQPLQVVLDAADVRLGGGDGMERRGSDRHTRRVRALECCRVGVLRIDGDRSSLDWPVAVAERDGDRQIGSVTPGEGVPADCERRAGGDLLGGDGHQTTGVVGQNGETGESVSFRGDRCQMNVGESELVGDGDLDHAPVVFDALAGGGSNRHVVIAGGCRRAELEEIDGRALDDNDLAGRFAHGQDLDDDERRDVVGHQLPAATCRHDPGRRCSHLLEVHAGQHIAPGKPLPLPEPRGPLVERGRGDRGVHAADGEKQESKWPGERARQDTEDRVGVVEIDVDAVRGQSQLTVDHPWSEVHRRPEVEVDAERAGVDEASVETNLDKPIVEADGHVVDLDIVGKREPLEPIDFLTDAIGELPGGDHGLQAALDEGFGDNE